MKNLSLAGLTALLVLLAASSVSGGIYLEQSTHVDAITVNGQSMPARDAVQKLWIDQDRMLAEYSDGGLSVLVRRDLQKIFFIDRQKRSYMEAALPIVLPTELAQMVSAFQVKCTVRKTGAQKQIGSWACEGADLVMTGFVNSTVKLWFTPASFPVTPYYDLTAEMSSFNPGLKDMIAQIRSLGNVLVVEQEMTGEVMGAQSRTVTRLIRCDQLAVPAGRFEVPPGFRAEMLDFKKIAGQGQ